MPLDYHHQVTLLKDILTEQQADCCGTVAECEQIERLIKSLMVNAQIDQNVKNVLQNIYEYSQSGKSASELNQHITSQQQNLTQWIQDIDSFS
ncbi:YtzH-like family protein [Metabacillus sp. KIGAM252]|uniref:YtzH-like family protein n=1 Tax=Metabacillus flavus TaxID=2823519 RepID=A0ABS5LH37_9BACI|nr:YtzH-like family protein [Metabacillus flavus]MBS2970066.1 YtzH-like family protein [Metabacillus flavus]